MDIELCVALFYLANKSLSDFAAGTTTMQQTKTTTWTPTAQQIANARQIVHTANAANIEPRTCTPCFIPAPHGTPYYGLTPAQCQALGGLCQVGMPKAKRKAPGKGVRKRR